MSKVDQAELYKKAVQENQVRGEALDKEFGTLLEELKALGGGTQTYAADSVIEIPGTLFSTVVNFISHNAKTLENLNNAITTIVKQTQFSVDVALTNNAAMSVEVIKEHINQVKVGKTVSNETIDKENAEVKVKEIKKPSKSKKVSEAK